MRRARAFPYDMALKPESRELTTVEVGSAPIERHRPLLEKDVWSEFERMMDDVAGALSGRTLWNINSAARGGGVAELLSSLIPYDRGVGIDERWVVLKGSPEFFEITKKIHKLLHGVPSDGSAVTDHERRINERRWRAAPPSSSRWSDPATW